MQRPLALTRHLGNKPPVQVHKSRTTGGVAAVTEGTVGRAPGLAAATRSLSGYAPHLRPFRVVCAVRPSRSWTTSTHSRRVWTHSYVPRDTSACAVAMLTFGAFRQTHRARPAPGPQVPRFCN